MTNENMLFREGGDRMGISIYIGKHFSQWRKRIGEAFMFCFPIVITDFNEAEYW